MSKITLLDQNTINKIAAGEVIERPAAVVKELVENAIDAGSNAITIEIKDGGLSLIRITDNGIGIAKDEIELAFMPHATSKIKSVEDLLTVSSLGFRGEALSSIAAVTQLELITKTAGELTGSRYLIEGGEKKGIEEIGCPEGTTFLVRNLFYNTPARRKFLKSPQTEAGYISELVERLAVSHPQISFKFLNNNQMKLHTSGNDNLKDIIYHVYGREIAANLLGLDQVRDRISVKGFIGKPIISRGNRNYMNCFINGRYIKSAIINKAIEDAYKPYSMSLRYPFVALHFQIDVGLIDVNVHPTKMEIRFTNNEEVYELAFQAVSNALKEKELIPEILTQESKKPSATIHVPMPEPFEKQRIQEATKQEVKTQEVVRQNVQSQDALKRDQAGQCEGKQAIQSHDLIKQEIINQENVRQVDSVKENSLIDPLIKDAILHDVKLDSTSNVLSNNNIAKVEEDSTYGTSPSSQLNLFEDKLLSSLAVKEHRIIGQLFLTYWIVEYHDKMFIIDQHAAHEKVLFEKTMKHLREKEYSSQILLPPIILSLSMREEEVLKEFGGSLHELGFEIESFGGKEYSVRAVPANLPGIGQKELLIELLDDLIQVGTKQSSELLLEKVASMSCKAAVKGNNRLSQREAEALIGELLELDNPYHCPHGRPTIISMSKYEIEKKFKRII